MWSGRRNKGPMWIYGKCIAKIVEVKLSLIHHSLAAFSPPQSWISFNNFFSVDLHEQWINLFIYVHIFSTWIPFGVSVAIFTFLPFVFISISSQRSLFLRDKFNIFRTRLHFLLSVCLPPRLCVQFFFIKKKIYLLFFGFSSGKNNH